MPLCHFQNLLSRLVLWSFIAFSPKKPSRRFIISDLRFMPIIQIKWILIYAVRWGANFFLLYMNIQASQDSFFFFFWRDSHFLMCLQWHLCKNTNILQLCRLISGFSMYSSAECVFLFRPILFWLWWLYITHWNHCRWFSSICLFWDKTSLYISGRLWGVITCTAAVFCLFGA